MSYQVLLAGLGFPLAVWTMWRVLRRLFTKRENLEGKVVLITGASSGVGEACAHAFHRIGARVILCARREAELERVKNDLMQKAGQACKTYNAEVLPLDLSDMTDVNLKAERALSLHGRVDVLINNGGISCRGSVSDTQIEVFKKLMDVNFMGHVALTKALLPDMVQRRQGSIVEVSSVQGKMAIPHRSPYAASKHAVQAFFDSLRAEVAESNVNVCVISPGYIATNISKHALSADGTAHGEMDDTTAGGMSAEYVANQIVSAVELREQELILDSALHKAAIYIRTLSPWLFFYIMKKRAQTKPKTS